MLDEAVAIAVVEVDDNFCVRARVEHMPARLEFGAQLDEVEDLAVEHRPHRACGVVDRLVAGGQVDDRKSRVRQADAGFGVEAVAVRSAVREGVDHSFQQRPLRAFRSEEHTSELQSLMRISYAVFCLKKKKNKRT